MCVPGPGAYLEAGPRRVPGRASVGSAIAMVGFVASSNRTEQGFEGRDGFCRESNCYEDSQCVIRSRGSSCGRA
jgi:hypothetical protein